MLRLENLRQQYDSFALQNISLDVRQGECFVLVGPTGSGKTLLLETALGLRESRSGAVFLHDKNVTRQPPEQRGFSYLPQDLALFPHLSVRQNILFGARIRHLPFEKVRDQFELLTGALNLTHLIGRREVRQLSGGEKQRIALARALLVPPKILFLDEPFSSLDLRLRRELEAQFQELQAALKLTVLLVTHDQEEAFFLADRMALLLDGRIVQIGRPDEFYQRPATLDVARFLRLQNIYEATVVAVESGQIRVRIGRMTVEVPTDRPLAVGQGLVLVARPEEVALGADGPGEGVVQTVRRLGPRWSVALRAPDANGLAIECSLSPAEARTADPRPGRKVRFRFRPEAFLIFEA